MPSDINILNSVGIQGLVNEFFGKKDPQNENTGKEQIKKPKVNEINFV